MFESAMLKIDRATKHVCDLNKLFREKRPFSYVVETNTQTRQRATYAKKDKAVINETALICGDIAHNLRSALDHAFWEIVSPHATTDRERKLVQFPFCEKEARLDEAVKQRFADRAGSKFFAAIMGLRPYRETGGSEFLHLIHEMDLLDKHKLLIPTGDYTRLSASMVKDSVPDFPDMIENFQFGSNTRDVLWPLRLPLSQDQLGVIKAPTNHIFERELDVPVEIVFKIAPSKDERKVVPSLNAMVDVAKKAIEIMRAAV